MKELTIFDTVLPELLSSQAADLHRVLDGPTLIHLAGRRAEPLFVSVLLHGNETTGWECMRALLRKFRDRPPPRALSLLIGNVAAARDGVRRLEQQIDYNRIWPVVDHGDGARVVDPVGAGGPEARIMAQVVEEMRSRSCFASIDIHNTTGSNPHYGCVNRLEGPFLNLARLFGRTIIYFLRPLGVQSAAFAEFCPAVTIECGKPEGEAGVQHAMDFVETVLHLEKIPAEPPPFREYDLFHTVATVRVPEGARFSFAQADDSRPDFRFAPDFDHWNFREVRPGATFAHARGAARLTAWDEAGREVGEEFFEYRPPRRAGANCPPGEADEYPVLLKKTVMPSMLTLNPEIVRQDCLGYFMERMQQPEIFSGGSVAASRSGS